MVSKEQDIFQHSLRQQIERESPLANRMRPRTLGEFVGQEHIIGQGRLLRRAIEADQLSSLIFYGPPGTGKTTLAMVIANTTKSDFVTLNAVLAGVKQLREVIDAATERRALYGRRTTLFIDEVHRWNKAQQDALLPHVERGTIIFIGATTANPYFEVQKALVSRSRIFQLLSLDEDHLRQIVFQALEDDERGYGRLQIDLAPEALDHLVNVANGDARSVLNALELAVETTQPDEKGVIVITLNVAEESIQRRAVLYDKDGDAHYDTISAFIKSLRGSDPDAALYWAAKMIYAGEDPRFIFRRMGIFAGEDVGMADPQAAVVVESCWSLFERIGMPEGQFPLAQAILYLATAPKSNSAFGFFDALNIVKEEREADVPTHLRDSNRDKEGFGHGAGYKYPHAYQDHWVAQRYLPGSLQERVFYQPGDQGYERQLADQVLRRREEQLAALLASEEEAAETLTTSPARRGREAWLQRTMSSSGQALGQVRDKVFALANVQRHHLVLDVNADSGLLLWEAVRRAPEGGVWGMVSPAGAERLGALATRLPELERPSLITSLDDLLATAVRVDRLIGHNPLSRLPETSQRLARWRECLLPDGMVVIGQTVPRAGQRVCDLVDWQDMAELRAQVTAVEESLWTDPDNPLTNWSAEDLLVACRDAGWDVTAEAQAIVEQRRLSRALVQQWFDAQNPYRQALVAAGFTPGRLDQIEKAYTAQLADQTVNWHTQVVFLVLR